LVIVQSDRQIMKKQSLQNLLFLAGIAFIFIIALRSFRGPVAVKATDSSTEFSAYRAMEHIKFIARKPHSMGTEAHAEVRKYIIDQLESMGLETSIQEATVIDDRRNLRAATVYNVVGVLRGANSTKAMMVVAHYDSTPHTLGASDDGAGVSSMLETIRVLTQSQKLKNDLIFLFTDGEESGLFGAKAFVNENKLANEVGLVLNLEARGSSGPAYTYEVSQDNGWIMGEYYKAVRSPIATSLAYEVYKLMPNSSDFTVFKNAGMSGFNIAFIEDFVNYHSMTDSPENIDLRSLQHVGNYALDLVNHFGNVELLDPKTPDLLYFNVIGNMSIHFKQSLSIYLLIFSVLLFIAILFIGIRKKQIKVLKSLLSVLIFLLSIVVISFAIFFLNLAILNEYSIYGAYYSFNFYNAIKYLIAFMLISLALFSFIYALISKKIDLMHLMIGVLFVNLIGMIALYVYIPTAIYICLVPAIMLSSAILITLIFNLNFEKNRMLIFRIYFIALFPIIGFYLPMIKVLFVTFSLEFPNASIALWLVFLGFLLVPMKAFFDLNRWMLPLISIVIGVFFLFLAHQTSTPNQDRPLQSSIFYAANHETESAYWVSNITEADSWNQQFFENPVIGELTEIYPYAREQRLINSATYLASELPQLEAIIDSVGANGRRNLSFTLKSAINAENFQLYINANAVLKDFKIDGKLIENEYFYSRPYTNYHILNYYAWPDDGVIFSFECNADLPVEMLIFEKKLGLPEQLDYKPMPEWVIPQTGYESCLSLVKSTFQL